MYIYHRLFCRCLHSLKLCPFFLSIVQEQKNIYPNHSYNSPLPNPVSHPAQEDLGGPRKNGDPNTQEHAVINLTTATTHDTITLHTGKAIKSPVYLLSLTALQLCLSLCFFFFFQLCAQTRLTCGVAFCVKRLTDWLVLILQHRHQERSTTHETLVTALSHRLTLTMTSIGDDQR